MLFPTAHSTIYRNEDGEVLGWDNHYWDEPEYVPYEDSVADDVEFATVAECKRADMHGRDGEGTGTETEDGEEIYDCVYCPGRFYITDEGVTMELPDGV